MLRLTSPRLPVLFRHGAGKEWREPVWRIGAGGSELPARETPESMSAMASGC